MTGNRNCMRMRRRATSQWSEAADSPQIIKCSCRLPGNGLTEKIQIMKKYTIIGFSLSAVIGLTLVTGCGSKRDPGRAYMPDMGDSRAIETYSALDSALFTTDKNNPGSKIYYDRKPVEGTIERGELFPYTLPNDSVGYAMSAQVKNPLPPLKGADSLEAARLFNINCAICHGAGAAGNGPISTAGHIGGIANLTLPNYVAMADGTMYHSINYGKNLMGSYAPQLSRKQRWQIVQYIRTLQPKPAAGKDGQTGVQAGGTGTAGATAGATGNAATAGSDSAAKKK
jgi:mono/diheme cytochrome c family protein